MWFSKNESSSSSDLTGKHRDWRDRASFSLLQKFFKKRKIEGRILGMLDSGEGFQGSIWSASNQTDVWNRTVGSKDHQWFWPEKDSYDAAILRLPQSKRELEMCVHIAFSSLRAECPLWVYGSNDEGIKSSEKVLWPLAKTVTTVAYGGRCRVLQAMAPSEFSYKDELSDWKNVTRIDLPGFKRDWVSYPGVFADGKLDSGTEVLIKALPSIPEDNRVLDFACGTGLVGGVVDLQLKPGSVDFLDIDLIALVAVQQNIPGARVIPSDGFSRLEEERYDMIVSNPPYHRGKTWSEDFIMAMVAGAAAHLNQDGTLVFVAQRRLQIERLISSHFRKIKILSDQDSYRVWSATL